MRPHCTLTTGTFLLQWHFSAAMTHFRTSNAQKPNLQLPFKPLQEGEALERAQRAGEAASSLAGERMAEQWIALTRTPEWRTLAARFPATIRQLSAAAAAGGDGEGGGAASHVEWVGSGGERHDEAT